MTDGRFLEQLQALDLAQVAVSATIDEHGHLGPVAGLRPKLQEAAVGQVLRIVVVAEAQSDVPPDLERPTATPLRVLRAATVKQAVERLYQEYGPRADVCSHVRERCTLLDILGTKSPIEKHYQAVPLLREVKQELLPREQRPPAARGRGEERDGRRPPEVRDDAGLQLVDVFRWEEVLQEKQVHYEVVALEEVLANFQRVAPNAKSAVPRFVVLGPPGSGKTTLIQYLAWRLARHDLRLAGRLLVPVRVRLREWEAWAVKTSGLDTSLPAYLAYCYKDILDPPPEPDTPESRWRDWLRAGDVFLLLDGLDEIKGAEAVLSPLQQALSSAPEQARSLKDFSACPVLMTCRTVSFEQHRAICPDFPVFTLAGLDDAGRDAFIRAYPTKHPVQFDADGLIKHIRQSPAMRPLTANPLLLSLICLVVDGSHNVSLPATRGQLYNKVVDRLLKGRRPGVAPQVVPEIRRRRILERATLALFAAAGQGRQLIFDEDRLLKELEAGAQVEGLRFPSDVADALRIDLLNNSGVLRGDPEQGYFFLHLTVQEFMAASALAREIREHGWRASITVEGVKVSVEHLVDRKAWDPRWQEVILLLAGQLDDPVPLLELLAEKKKDDYFRHRLALAALCLGEIPLDRLTGCQTQVDQITSSASELCWQYYRTDTEAAVPYLIRALPALGRANGIWDGEPLLARLAGLLENQDQDVRKAAAKVVGGLGVASPPEILGRLTGLLADTNWDVRWAVVEAFGARGVSAATPEILARLGGLLANRDGEVRCAAAKAVGGMGAAAATSGILAGLAALLEDRSVRSTTFKIGMMYDAPGKQTQQVSSKVHTTRYVQQAAAETVGKLGAAAATPEILTRLAELLADRDLEVRGVADPMWIGASEVRSAAREAVGRLGAAAATPDFLARLAGLLADEVWGVRRQAALAVSELGAPAATLGFLAQLADLLADANGGVREAAAWAAGWLGAPAAKPEILELVARLLVDVNKEVREAAAQALGGLGAAAAKPEHLRRLAGLLADEAEEVRWAASRAIGSLGAAAATPEFLAHLADLLAGANRVAAWSAADAIGGLGASAATQESLERLARLLDDQDQDVRKATMRAVGGLGAAAVTPDILVRLNGLMADQASGVRAAAASAVGGLGAMAATPRILERLADLMVDQVATVRQAAAQAVSGSVLVSFRITDRFREKLRS